MRERREEGRRGGGEEGRRGGGKVCRSECGGWELEEGKPNLPASKFRMLVTTAAVYSSCIRTYHMCTLQYLGFVHLTVSALFLFSVAGQMW